MDTNADDDLWKALALLKKSAPNAPCSSRRPGGKNEWTAVGELLLAELKLRRARLLELIDMLSREALGEKAHRVQPSAARMAPHTCRRRRARGER